MLDTRELLTCSDLKNIHTPEVSSEVHCDFMMIFFAGCCLLCVATSVFVKIECVYCGKIGWFLSTNAFMADPNYDL